MSIEGWRRPGRSAVERKRRVFGLGGFDFYIPSTNSIIEAHSIRGATRKRDGALVLVVPPARKSGARADTRSSSSSELGDDGVSTD